MPISKELEDQLNEPDYYARLGLKRNAEEYEIKNAYRKISLITHPDKNNGDDSLFKQAGEAYKILIDAQERAKYDLSLQGSTKTNSKSKLDTAPSSAPTMITEDINSLEKINNLISKIEKNISNIPFLSTINTLNEFEQQFSKIKLKQEKYYFINSRKLSALDRAVKKLFSNVRTDITNYLIRTKIYLTDPSLLDIDVETANPEIVFQKILAVTEDIKKQIQDTIELLKNKTQDPEFIELRDRCMKFDSNTSILENVYALSVYLKKKYDSLSQDPSYTPEFKNKIKNLYNNRELSPMVKLSSIYKEIDDFKDAKKLKEKYSSIMSNPMYSDEFKATIKLINLNNSSPSEKLKKISALERQYQEMYISENNVNAIYTLLNKNFPAFKQSEYQVSELENDDVFSRTYRQVQKLESFFQKIVNHYTGKSPYKESKEFIRALLKLNSEDKTITEKFDSISRLVGDFEHKYLQQKLDQLDDAHWALFNEALKRPTDLTMANFSKFHDEQTNKFIPQLEEFTFKIQTNSSFREKNRAQIESFTQNLTKYKMFKSPEILSELISTYSNLKDKFDLHIENEKPKKSAVETSSTPTSSNTPNQVHEKSTTKQRNNDLTTEIKKKLSKYRARIETNKNVEGKPDYAHGFLVLKKSRAISRKINYILAIKLLDHLNTNPGDFSIYEKVMELRQGIVDELTREDKKHYAERGINSTELNEIIKAFKPKK